MISPYYLLQPWLLPPGCNILLAIIGLILYFYKRPQAKIFLYASLLTLWLASTPFVAYHLIEGLQNVYPVLALDKIYPDTSRAAIVVLGGGSDINIERGNIYTVSDATFNRLGYAAYLHKKTGLPIIVSGGKTHGAQSAEADLMQTVLQHDFNITTLFKEDQSFNTADEAKFLAPMLKEHQIDTIYIVTNAWHMPRSLYAFRGIGARVVPAPMGYNVYDHHYTILSFLPNTNALSATSIAMHEYVGMIWYRFKRV
ncbi:MAG: YdcF family protein [Gammaproteobacteria bacterium]|nr:YdcF family protein [Gammaproteobacteria bacterium]